MVKNYRSPRLASMQEAHTQDTHTHTVPSPFPPRHLAYVATHEKAIHWQVHLSLTKQSASVEIRPPLQKAWRCVRSGSPPIGGRVATDVPKVVRHNLEISDYSQMTPKCPTDCLKLAPRWHQRQHDQAGPPRTSAERPERHRATCPKYP